MTDSGARAGRGADGLRLRARVAASLLGTSLLLATPVAVALDLHDSVVEALARNPDVRAAEWARRSADHQRRAAFGGYLPRLDLDGGYTRQDVESSLPNAGPRVEGQFDYPEGRATLTQMLFDGFNVSRQVDRADARVRASAHGVGDTAQTIGLNTIGTYLEVIRRQRSAALAEANLGAHRQIRDMIRRRSATGVGRRSDFDQADARLSLAANRLREEQAALADAEASYQRLVGLPAAALAPPSRPRRALPGAWADEAAAAPVDDGRSANDEIAELLAPLAVLTAPMPAEAERLSPEALAELPLDDAARGRSDRLACGGASTPVPAPDSLMAFACRDPAGQNGEARVAMQATRSQVLPAALAAHPAVRAARANVSAAEAEVGLAASAYLPTVNLEVSALTSEDRFRDTYQDYRATVRGRWNLFRGGTDEASRLAAAARVEQARDELRATEYRITQELSVAANQLLAARDRLDALRLYADAIVAARAAYVRQFTIGQRTLLDLVNAQDEAFSARTQVVTAELSELFSAYRVFAASGRLLEALDVPLPEAAVAAGESAEDAAGATP